MGIFGVTFVVLLVIKLLEIAVISWWLVFSPVIIWFAFVGFVAFLAALAASSRRY